jgi:hypothetical protein
MVLFIVVIASRLFCTHKLITSLRDPILKFGRILSHAFDKLGHQNIVRLGIVSHAYLSAN